MLKSVQGVIISFLVVDALYELLIGSYLPIPLSLRLERSNF